MFSVFLMKDLQRLTTAGSDWPQRSLLSGKVLCQLHTIQQPEAFCYVQQTRRRIAGDKREVISQRAAYSPALLAKLWPTSPSVDSFDLFISFALKVCTS